MIKLSEPIQDEDRSFNEVINREEARAKAPNRLVDFVELKASVEPELTMCSRCGGDRVLCDDDSKGIEMGMVVKCIDCDVKNRGLRKKLKNMKARMDVVTTKSVKDIYRKKIKYLESKVTKVRKKKITYSVLSNVSTPVSSPENITFNATDSPPASPPTSVATSRVNTNLRAMMTAFYLGTGPRDVGNALYFLGVPGGHT